MIVSYPFDHVIVRMIVDVVHIKNTWFCKFYDSLISLYVKFYDFVTFISIIYLQTLLVILFLLVIIIIY